MKNRWTYIKEYKMRQIILGGIVLGNLLIFIIGAVILRFLPENSGKSLSEVVQYSLKLMVDSGGFMDNVTNLPSIILTVIIVLAGMICFTGGIIAYMSNMVTNLVDNAEGGNTKLKLKKHIVILNWNSKVPLLVADYTRDKKRQYIVIITDKDKNEVLTEIKDSLNRLVAEDRETGDFKQKRPRIIVRKPGNLSGRLFKDICLTDATSFIIVSPDGEMSKSACDSYVIKQFMMAIAYIADYISEDDYNNDITAGELDIIVELQDDINKKYISDYPLPKDDGTDCIKAVAVTSNEVLGKIIASTVINPDLHKVITEILSFKGSELYALSMMDTDGIKSLEEGNNNIELVDFSEDMLGSNYSIPLFDIGNGGDRLRIYLSMDSKNASKVPDEFDMTQYLVKEEGTEDWILKREVPDDPLTLDDPTVKKDILIIGYNDKLPYIFAEFKKFIPNGVSISLAYTSDYEKNEMTKLCGNDTALYDLTDIMNDDAIESAMTGESDILVLSSEQDKTIIDRIPLLIWNLVQRRNITEKNFYIEVLEPQNSEVIKVKDIGGNLFLSNRYVSGLCTQLGTDGNLYEAFSEMFEAKSRYNIWTYDAAKFYRSDSQVKFETKKEAVLWTYMASDEKAVLIGVVRDGVSYLFTNNLIGIDECSLYPYNYDGTNDINYGDEFIIEPTDKLIILDKGNHS